MTGTYRTLDNCEYEVFLHQPDKRKKAELMVRCIKSTVRTGSLPMFMPIPGQIERNIRHNLWIKL